MIANLRAQQNRESCTRLPVELIGPVDAPARDGPTNGMFALQRALRKRIAAGAVDWLSIRLAPSGPGALPWFWRRRELLAAGWDKSSLPFLQGPNVLFINARNPRIDDCERRMLDAPQCRAMFCHTQWYRRLIAEQRRPPNLSPIVLWPYPIDPCPGPPLPAEYDLLIYAKSGHTQELVSRLAAAFRSHRVVRYGSYQREELFEAARRARVCAYLSDNDHGPLALQEILLAGCPAVGVRTGAAFVRDGVNGFLIENLPPAGDFTTFMDALDQARQLDRDTVRSRALAEYSPDAVADLVVAALDSARAPAPALPRSSLATRRPVPRADLTVETLGPESVLMRSETEAHWLEGTAYPLILPLLDGRPAQEVAAALAGQLEPETVHCGLAVLRKRGLLAEHCPGMTPDQQSFWSRLGVDRAAAALRLGESRVAIRSIGAAETTTALEFAAALRAWDVRVVESGGSITVVLTADYRDPALSAINREAIADGRAWMLLNPVSRVALAGPVFRPGVSACWSCLAHRLEENLLTVPVVTSEPLGPLRSMALQFTATELTKWIARASPALDSAILSFDPATFATRRHQVHRRPQCPVCGEPGRATSFASIALQSQRKIFTADGGFRTCPPQETAARLESHVSPITGIIPAVSLTTSAGNGAGTSIYTTRIHGPFGSLFHREALAGRPLSAAGKGMTAAQSRAGCLAEAVERYSACFQGHEPLLRASAAELGAAAVMPGALLGFSERQYRERDRWNAAHARPDRVPEAYPGDAPLDWVPAWSITNRSVRYLPAAYVFIDYASPQDLRYCTGDSNGCAAGNTIEEAILQGFLELVERDALAIWWYNRLRRPSRNIVALDDRALAESADTMRALGRALHILDITHDLGIPAFAAVSSTLAGDSIRIGSGAHLDPRLALTRAVAEVHQSLAWPRAAEEGSRSRSLAFSTAPQLAPSPDLEWRDRPTPTTTDLLDDVNRCVETARRQGLEVLVTNLTRPDIGFPVVRVTVPGLRHYRPRLGPGRLYGVPVKMGWIAQPLTEAELHPEPLVL